MPSAKPDEAASARARPGSPPISAAARMAAPTWSVMASAASAGTGKPAMASLTRGR